MKNNTIKLKKILSNLKTLDEKIALLEGSYKGEECFIITAGPSLNSIDTKKLYEKLKNKLVICVKQSFELFNEISDFHLINPYNYKDYNYNNNNTIKVYVKPKGESFFTPNLTSDIELDIVSDYSRENCLCNKNNYEEYTFENNFNRPYGPGIIHEVGIYLPILLGVKKITFISWDLGSIKNDQIKRFYTKGIIKAKLELLIYKLNYNLYNKYYVTFYNYYCKIKYLLGFKNTVLNNPGMTENEAKFISESTELLYEWFAKKNIDVCLLSNSSMLSSKFKRINIDEIA